MEEFTVEEVIGYQIEIIRASGVEEDQGLEGRLLNPGNLDFVITASNDISDPFKRAAFVLHGLVTGHPFVQGNKRIAFLLAALILLRNDTSLQAPMRRTTAWYGKLPKAGSCGKNY
ncbi:MAG: Fic family protein [Methanomicrobiales archaeon]|jgi:death-on-curing protein|nr:Fic family protein [Methanomicrobiales archaeon]